MRLAEPQKISNKEHSGRFHLLVLCALALTVLVVVANGGFLRKHLSASERRNESAADIVRPALDDPRRIETELITVTRTGFEPLEITRPQGQFLLDVDNRSELNALDLYLERQNGARERSAKVQKTAPELRLPLDLSPGTYFLREAGHNSWICTINITAK